jgi:hypothetical protein
MNPQDVVAAMREYDRQFPANEYDSWLTNGKYRWAVSHGGNLYPPKWLIGYLTATATPDFHHNTARRALRQCGFPLVPKP